MRHAQRLLKKEEKIAIVGLGYVGMPLAVAFAKLCDVIGFDVNSEKIALYHSGVDPTNEVGDAAIRDTTMVFTDDEGRLDEARFFIVAVPTPVNVDKTPDLSPVAGATAVVGRHLKKGDIVVYESTVYPGVTEDICIPILEKESGLSCGADFGIGYSPERINPGDRVHTLFNITKIVSGRDDATRDEIADVYAMVVEHIYKAPCIKVAEAAKVAENSQRDINIAFMNELAMSFSHMDINTNDVVDAMNTKWNALGFRPGLVGGHCIGVDPYYLTYEAEMLGYYSRIISEGRRVNDGMGSFVAENVVHKLIEADKLVRRAKVAIMGLTFKENCPDVRNSKVVDIIKRLRYYGIEPLVSDPYADADEAMRAYGLTLIPTEAVQDVDCLVFAVAHAPYKDMSLQTLCARYAPGKRVLIDVKSIYSYTEAVKEGYVYWQL